MTEPHKVHCFAHVDRPYESVRSVLHGLLVTGETKAFLSVHSICDPRANAGLPDATRATLCVKDQAPCESRELAAAELYASALSSSATRIEIEAHCVDRTAGVVDAIARDFAEAHVHAVLENIVQRIRVAVDAAGERGATLAPR